MVADTAFDISLEEQTKPTLVVGQAHLGMAGVTAADYLVRHLDSRQIGHVDSERLPAIAPFEEGVPRHHSRLYAIEDTDLTVLVGELFIPPGAARSYTDELLEMAGEQGIEEILVLHGTPFPHGPDEHEVFSVATPEYRETRLAETPIQPLQGGFLDGVAGEIVTRCLDDRAPDTGVFVTPTHPPGPDIEAALKFIVALEDVYDISVDESELRELGDRFAEYYEQLEERMSTMTDTEESDRMFM